MIDDGRNSFRDEAFDLLAKLEETLLELEKKPDDAELVGKLFRTMHTIKGSGAMFGFDDVAEFTHELETAFDLIRQGKAKVTRPLIDLTLTARDLIRAMIDAAFGGEKVDEADKTALAATLRLILQDFVDLATFQIRQPDSQKKSEKSTPAPAPLLPEKTWRIRFHPGKDLFRGGTNPILLLNELRALGETKVISLLDNIVPLADLDPEACYLGWNILLTSAAEESAIRDVFIFVESDSTIDIGLIDEGTSDEAAAEPRKIGEILEDQGVISHEDLVDALADHQPLGRQLVEAGKAKPGQVEAALQEQHHLKELRRKKQGSESISGIRVPSERLDSLVNLIGELVTTQARLSQTSLRKNDPEFIAISEILERLTWELRDSALNIRMLPIGSTFSKFHRMVRDLSAKLGRQVEMTTEGEETELDKTVIEKLGDPLIHLIRNCLDHGFESPEERKTAGKPPVGRLHLSALHSGAYVLIKVSDDGRGLDAEGIKRKALEKGLIQPEAILSEKELYSLIFLPGFSTAKQVTNISGRGVGMDVVKRAVEELRGTVDITSVLGEGATVTVKLPLTLAIINGLLVRINDRFFVLPLVLVHECVELTKSDVQDAHGKHVAIVRGEMVPYINLREQFNISGEIPDIQQIVIAEVEGLRIGFVVDHVVGEHQTVIKSLGSFYRNVVEEFSGATILGDGSVALILDVAKMVRLIEHRERAAQA